MRRRSTSLLPDSSVDKVWRSPADTPSGPAGMVLTVDFTLNGQHFQGLNGGPVQLQRGGFVRHRVRGPGRGRPAVGCAHGGRRRAGPVRMAQRPIRAVVADRSAAAERARWRSRSGACAPRHGGDAQDEQDRCRRAPAGGRRPRGRELRLMPCVPGCGCRCSRSLPTRAWSQDWPPRRRSEVGTGCSCGISSAGVSRFGAWPTRGSRWRRSPLPPNR